MKKRITFATSQKMRLKKMKSCKFLFAIAFALFFGCQLVSAQSKGVVYIFGLSDSTRDSIVYVTGVQRIDMANLQKQTKFLLDRADYAQQLKDYFANRLNDNKRINVVYVCKNEKAAKKKLQKVRRNYLEEGAIVQQLASSDFTFVPIVGVSDNSADTVIESGVE